MPEPSPNALTDSIIENDKNLDRMVKDYGEQIKDLVPPLMEAIKNLRDSEGKIRPEIVNMSFVADLLVQAGILEWTEIDSYLIEAAQDTQKKTEELYKDDDSQQELLNLDLILTPSDQEIFQIIQDIKDGAKLTFARITENMQVAVYSQLLSMQFSSVPLDDAASILAARQHISHNWAKTWLNTTMSGVQRRIELQQGQKLEDAGAEVFYMYLGPDKGKVRDFCKVLVGQAIRSKDLGKFKPPGGLAFPTHCGGYNCRHQLSPVTKSYIKRRKVEIVTKRTIDKANAAGG